MQPLDFLGNSIQPGDTIAYPVRRGSEMWMNKLTVQEVAADHLGGYSRLGRAVRITNFKNVIVVSKLITPGA